MDDLIRIENLTKIYMPKVVLNNISCSIPKGQSVAFVGHNGCGKSTLLKIIAGLVKPTSGKIECGKKLLFHYVPEHFPKMQLTAERYLRWMGRLDGIAEQEIGEKCRRLAADFFMTDMLNIPMKNLSKGTLQKIGVIQALLAEPQVLLLDEPLDGQDTDSQQVFIEKVNQLKAKEATILMSCHEPELIRQIADKVYRLENGLYEADDQAVNAVSI